MQAVFTTCVLSLCRRGMRSRYRAYAAAPSGAEPSPTSSLLAKAPKTRASCPPGAWRMPAIRVAGVEIIPTIRARQLGECPHPGRIQRPRAKRPTDQYEPLVGPGELDGRLGHRHRVLRPR